MSFAILRHGKISSTSKGSAIAHNHRTFDGDQVNIDGTMKHLNRCFMGEGLGDRINALLPQKMRKDAVVAVEVLLTASPEFFDEIEKDRTKLATNPTFAKWLKKTLDWAKKEFGKNLVDATLHMDESTPHVHLMAVPLTKDGRLCAKEVMARAELQRRQTQYAAAVSDLGLSRGDPASETKRRHIGLKEKPGSGGQLAQVQAQLDKAKADLLRLQKLSKEWSDKDLAKVKALKTEAASLAEQLTQAKAKEVTLTKKIDDQAAKLVEEEAKFAAMSAHYQAELDKGTPAHLIAPEAPKTPVEAIPAQWADIPIATKMDATYGTPVGIYGRQVVLHVGRGKHVLHTVPDGQPVPRLQQTEQSKHGIAR